MCLIKLCFECVWFLMSEIDVFWGRIFIDVWIVVGYEIGNVIG